MYHNFWRVSWIWCFSTDINNRAVRSDLATVRKMSPMGERIPFDWATFQQPLSGIRISSVNQRVLFTMFAFVTNHIVPNKIWTSNDQLQIKYTTNWLICVIKLKSPIKRFLAYFCSCIVSLSAILNQGVYHNDKRHCKCTLKIRNLEIAYFQCLTILLAWLK